MKILKILVAAYLVAGLSIAQVFSAVMPALTFSGWAYIILTWPYLFVVGQTDWPIAPSVLIPYFFN